MRLFSPCQHTRARLGVRVLALQWPGEKAKPAKAPSRLLSNDESQPARLTVYSVRLSTGQRRGAALSDYNAGVQLCLIGEDGSALMHRVPALNDPVESERELLRICKVVDQEAGANCQVAFAAPSSPKDSRAVKHRFLEGSVDEVSFLGPELGALRGLLVGPEQGRWFCDEIDVYSSRTGHTDRFVCREYLGDRAENSAAFLAPIDPDAVVYGSGNEAVVLSKQQAARLYAMNMQQYGELKTRLMAINAGLVGLGTAAIFAHGGSTLAAPFALGGGSGMLYQLLLMAAVDSVGPAPGGVYKAQEIKRGPFLAAQLALASPTGRTVMKAAGVAGSFLLLHYISVQTGAAEQPGGELKQLLAAFAGFLLYKWALIGAAVIPVPQLSQALPGGSGKGSKSRVDDRLD